MLSTSILQYLSNKKTVTLYYMVESYGSQKNAIFSARTATLIEHTVTVRSNIISTGVEYLNTRLTSKNFGMLMATAKATHGREYSWNLKYIQQI
jgi:hypothetical protein